jgi:hypothetical protein
MLDIIVTCFYIVGSSCFLTGGVLTLLRHLGVI